jgi:hypothetical protein
MRLQMMTFARRFQGLEWSLGRDRILNINKAGRELLSFLIVVPIELQFKTKLVLQGTARDVGGQDANFS